MWKIYSICIQGKWRIKKITQHLVCHCWADEQKQPLNHVTGNTALAGTHVGDDNAKQQTSQVQWGHFASLEGVSLKTLVCFGRRINLSKEN